MDADAKLLVDITAAIQAKDKERLKELKNTLGRYAWLKAWKEKGGTVKDFIDTPNPFVQFVD